MRTESPYKSFRPCLLQGTWEPLFFFLFVLSRNRVVDDRRKATRNAEQPPELVHKEDEYSRQSSDDVAIELAQAALPTRGCCST